MKTLVWREAKEITDEIKAYFIEQCVNSNYRTLWHKYPDLKTKEEVDAWIKRRNELLDKAFNEAFGKGGENVKELSELTIKLTIDATEALETLAKVKAELEQVVALQKEIAELKVQVSARPDREKDLTRVIELMNEFSLLVSEKLKTHNEILCKIIRS